ncbi:MAG: 1-acyl-sn-glycerol-3-phosphate acyltransferase [Candidatus Aminicenantes bacterium]|nr:1-acyl-sn-glycerol-3-phosphate acyltransferase [Candidatus Aminicenantes bacterium]
MRTLLLVPVCFMFVLLLIPILLVCFLLRLRTPLFFVARGALWILFKIVGIRIEVLGKEWLDEKKKYVFMCNHLSFMDGPLVFLVIPHFVRVIMKKPISRIPVIGPAMRFAGFIPVDRKGINTGKKSIEQATELMNTQKFSFLIFPEGTRSLDGKMGPFRRGGFFLAINSGVPLLPISMTGSFDLMPKGSFWIRRGAVRVKFHQAISTNGFTVQSMDGLMNKTRSIIQAGVNSLES